MILDVKRLVEEAKLPSIREAEAMALPVDATTCSIEHYQDRFNNTNTSSI